MTFADALGWEDGRDLIAALLKSCLCTLHSRSGKTGIASYVFNSRVCQYNECLIGFFYGLYQPSHRTPCVSDKHKPWCESKEEKKALPPMDLGTLEKIQADNTLANCCSVSHWGKDELTQYRWNIQVKYTKQLMKDRKSWKEEEEQWEKFLLLWRLGEIWQVRRRI